MGSDPRNLISKKLNLTGLKGFNKSYYDFFAKS